MKIVHEKNKSPGFRSKQSIMSASYTRTILFISVFLVFSVACATTTDSNCLQDESNGTSIVSKYLDNVIRMKYAPNFLILSSKVREDWADLGVTDESTYAKRFSTVEKRLLGYTIAEWHCISNDLMEVMVIKRETFEDPTVRINNYWYKMVNEDGVWKIDQYKDASDSTYNYLP